MDHKRLVINALASAGQVLILSVILFLVFRSVLGELGPDRFGLWSITLALASIGQSINLGMPGSVIKYVAKYNAQKDTHTVAKIIQTCLISTGVLITGTFLCMFPVLLTLLRFLTNTSNSEELYWILLAAMATNWFLALSGVVSASLEGLQRYSSRTAVTVGSSLVFAALCLLLTPHIGLAGLAVAYVSQHCLALVAGYLLLRRHIHLPLFPYHWDRHVFREMLGYGIRFQIAGISSALFDPVTKSLLSHYGSLAMVGYYEIAGKLVIYARRSIVSACQVLVPIVAEHTETSRHQLGKMYTSASRMVIFVAIPSFTLLAVLSPAISAFFLGKVEPEFVHIAILVTVGWFINTVSAIPFIFRLGTGDLRWNTITQVTTACANIMLGTMLGLFFGGQGVVVASVSSLILGSLIGLYTFNSEDQLSTSIFITTENFLLAVSSCLACIMAITVYHLNLLPLAVSALMVGLLGIFLMLPAMYGHSGWRRIESWVELLIRKRLARA